MSYKIYNGLICRKNLYDVNNLLDTVSNDFLNSLNINKNVYGDFDKVHTRCLELIRDSVYTKDSDKIIYQLIPLNRSTTLVLHWCGEAMLYMLSVLKPINKHISFNSMAEYENFFNNLNGFEQYHFWNNTDPDENVSQKEWSKRYRDWHKVLGNHRNNTVGVIKEFLDASSLSCTLYVKASYMKSKGNL